MRRLSSLTLNQRLALAAFLLGATAVFSHPTSGATVRINPRELALIVQRGADRVAPIDLAGWIIEGRSGYRLIDLRDAARYSRYHIPTAENIPLGSLSSASITPTEKVVLYSDDDGRSAQGWFLLMAEGRRNAYVLTGGIDGWTRNVLFPVIAEGADQSSSAKLQAISRHFGGGPRGAAPVISEPANLPAPPPSASAAGPRPKPKRKEGC